MAVTTTYTFDSTRTEFIANSNGTGNSQFLSNVTTLSGGGFALTYGTENGANDVPYVSIYNTATGAVSPLFLPYDASGTDMQGEPVITQLANGNVLVVWKEGAGGGNAIVQTVFDPLTGNAIGPREVIATAIAGNTDPEITVLAGGNYVITYVNAAGGITTNVYNSVGSIQSGPTIIGPGCSDPAIAATADGGFAVVLLNGGNIFSATYDSVGNFVSQPKFEVTGNTNSAPQVAALKGGGFAIVYDDSSFVGLPGIGLKLSTAAQDTVIRVDTFNSANGDRDPEITVLENGFIVVTWTHEFSGTDDDIYGHIFDANGTSISVSGNDLGGGVFVIDSSTLDQNQSSLAALLNGMFVTTWTNAQGDGSGDSISAEVLELTRTITGDGAVDFIIGDELRDTIFGGGGGDHLAGGKGNDSLHGDAGDDVLVVKASDGTDGAETLDGGIDRDTLELDIGNGGDFTFDLRNDTITSIEEIDVNGDFGNTSVATVVLNAAQFGAGVSTDAVFARIGDVAPALTVFMEGVTNLDLSALNFTAPYTVTINGDDDAETITGTTQNDTINGGGGVDTLTGGGGADTLSGGAGDDSVIVRQGDDAFGTETYDGGGDTDELNLLGGGAFDLRNDTIISFERLGFASGATDVLLNASQFGVAGISLASDIFNASATTNLKIDMGAVSNFNLSGLTVNPLSLQPFLITINGDGDSETITGTSQNDKINGNGGTDTLSGGGGNDIIDGGADNDVMSGGAGNDIYYVDNVLDSVVEGVAAGSDFIYTTVNYTLAANTERLFLSGTGNINGTGRNGQVDVLTGNSGNNILNGLTGNDVMRGGQGNDTYYVDSASDLVEEATNAGTDAIKSTVTFTMSLNTERLYLIGTAAIDGTGLAGKNDLIVGNGAANTINGLTGNDTLTGGLGADTFLFNSVLNGITNHDTITDFNVINDSIQLENSIFTALTTTGTLAANLFQDLSLGVQDGSEVIIYDRVNGDLYYDTNGAGVAGGLVLFADVTNNTALTSADFIVI
jgi:Ca2+-binding RTX toxin-like protein